MTFIEKDQGGGNFDCYFKNQNVPNDNSIFTIDYTQEQPSGDYLINKISIKNQMFFGNDIQIACADIGCAVNCICQLWSKNYNTCLQPAPNPGNLIPIYLTQNSDGSYSFYIEDDTKFYLLFNSDSYQSVFPITLSTDNTDKNKLLILNASSKLL